MLQWSLKKCVYFFLFLFLQPIEQRNDYQRRLRSGSMQYWLKNKTNCILSILKCSLHYNIVGVLHKRDNLKSQLNGLLQLALATPRFAYLKYRKVKIRQLALRFICPLPLLVGLFIHEGLGVCRRLTADIPSKQSSLSLLSTSSILSLFPWGSGCIHVPDAEFNPATTALSTQGQINESSTMDSGRCGGGGHVSAR